MAQAQGTELLEYGKQMKDTRGEWSKADQAPRNWDLYRESAPSTTGKIQQAHPTGGMQISNT